jgi:hypothetical protein
MRCRWILRCRWRWILFALLVCRLPCLGQDEAPTPPTSTPPPPLPPAFGQLFPEPSGHNGYEEIVLAGDLARASQTIGPAMKATATLAQKRRALADPGNARALALLRQGLAKPIHSPWQTDLSTPRPDFALIRQLARLLSIQQYVLLADGRTGQALDCLRDGLRLGYVVKSDAIIGALVGVAVDAIVLRQMARHLEQLGARDCDRLVALTREYLSSPDPTLAALEMERQAALSTLSREWFPVTGQPVTGQPVTGQEGGGNAPPPEVRALENELRAVLGADPAAAEALRARVEQRVNAAYDRQIAALRLPYWKRAEEPPWPADGSLAERLTWVVLPPLSQASTKFTHVRAQVQLLGVQAAIRRYRWEHDRPPDSLAELGLGSLLLDPFTGQPLRYERTGASTYDVYSAGPPKRDQNGGIVPGQREPVYLPHRPPS